LLTIVLVVTVRRLSACYHRILRHGRDICVTRPQHNIWHVHQWLPHWQRLRPTLSGRHYPIWKVKRGIWTGDTRRSVSKSTLTRYMFCCTKE